MEEEGREGDAALALVHTMYGAQCTEYECQKYAVEERHELGKTRGATSWILAYGVLVIHVEMSW